MSSDSASGSARVGGPDLVQPYPADLLEGDLHYDEACWRDQDLPKGIRLLVPNSCVQALAARHIHAQGSARRAHDGGCTMALPSAHHRTANLRRLGGVRARGGPF